MAKYLIVNADDYGMCKAANDTVTSSITRNRAAVSAQIRIRLKGSLPFVSIITHFSCVDYPGQRNINEIYLYFSILLM